MKVIYGLLALFLISVLPAQQMVGIRGQESAIYMQVTFGGGLKDVARLGTNWYLKSSAGVWTSQGTSDLCSDEINIWGPSKIRHIWRLTLWEQVRARTAADGDFTARIVTAPWVPNQNGVAWVYTRKGMNVSTEEIVVRDTIAFGDPDTTGLISRYGNFQVIGGKAKVCLSRSTSAADTVFREFLLEGQ